MGLQSVLELPTICTELSVLFYILRFLTYNLKMEAAAYFEMLTLIYLSIWRHNPFLISAVVKTSDPFIFCLLSTIGILSISSTEIN
jgi:hypothetical protein